MVLVLPWLLWEGRAWLDRTLAVSSDPGPLHVGPLLLPVVPPATSVTTRGYRLVGRSLELARTIKTGERSIALFELGALAGLAEGDAAREAALTEASLACGASLATRGAPPRRSTTSGTRPISRATSTGRCRCSTRA